MTVECKKVHTHPVDNQKHRQQELKCIGGDFWQQMVEATVLSTYQVTPCSWCFCYYLDYLATNF